MKNTLFGFLSACALTVCCAPRASALTATPSTTEGPYYTLSSANLVYTNPSAYGSTHLQTVEGTDNDLVHITAASTAASGTLTKLSGRLYNTAGTAIAGATIELWVADNNGIYTYVSASSGGNNYSGRDRNFQGFGKTTTTSSGYYEFLTIRPGLYTGRIRHYHLKVKVGSSTILTTQFMPADEAASTPSDGIVAGLGSSLSLCTYTPSSGSFSWGSASYTGLIVSKDLVINYTPAATTAKLVNVSSRARVETGDNVVIAGFVIAGTGSKNVLVRGLGPTLAASGITNPLADPVLSVYDAAGSLVGSNDNWRTNQAAVSATGLAPASDLDAALTLALAPGAYTAVLGGVNSGTGTGLVEVYDLSTTDSAIRISNLSTRAQVQTGQAVLIGGIVVQGTVSRRFLVRALGPTLANFGVANVLADPTIELMNASGVSVATNDNWASATNAAEVTASGLAPTDARESALLVTLTEGAYTIVVRGVGDTSGVGLVEFYELP